MKQLRPCNKCPDFSKRTKNLLFTACRRKVGGYSFRLFYGLFCLLATLASVPLAAQSVRYTNLSAADGLSQNTITALFQDSKGFLWIGTPDGLDRYDGYNFLEYKHLANDSTTLIDNRVTAIVEDNFQNLWVATEGGLNKLVRKTNQFLPYTFQNTGDLPHRQIQTLFKDKKGNLWVGSKQGLSQLIFDEKTGSESWVHFSAQNQKFALLSQKSVTALAQDERGDMWIGTDSAGLFRLSFLGNQTEVKAIAVSENGLRSAVIHALATDKRGYLWVGTAQGLQCYQLEKDLWTHYTQDPTKSTSLNENQVLGLLLDREQNLWIGTATEGVAFLSAKEINTNPTQPRFIRYTKDIYDPQSLSDNTAIRALYQDYTGIIWIGTGQGGLNKYDPKRIKFRHYQAITDIRQNGLSDNKVTAFLKDNEDRLWIATKSGGLNRFDPKIGNGWWTTYTRYFSKLPSDNITGVVQDRYGTIWLSTRDGGAARFSYSSGALNVVVYKRKYRGEDNIGLPSNEISTLFLDKSGEVWLLTYQGDLCKYNRSANDFEVKMEGEAFKNDIPFAAYTNAQGKFWIGTPKGFFLYDPLGEKIIRDYRPKHNAIINSFHQQQDTLWIGSSKGLMILHLKNDSVGYITRKNGLPTDMIYAALVGKDGKVWISTNRGVACYNPKNPTKIKVYDKTNGLQGDQFNAGAYYMSAEGEIFFGGDNGYNAFFPEEVTEDPIAPRIIITDIEVFTKNVPFYDPTTKIDQPLKSYVTEADTLWLDYEKNAFSLEFAALHFADPKKNLYAYKMEGLDEDWQYVNAGRRFVNYPNLPYGDFVFKIKAANADGTWNEEGIALVIKVIPPIWSRPWFQIGLGLLVVGAVSAGIWAKFRAEKKQREYLESEVERQTKEIRRKNQTMLDSIRSAENIQNAILVGEAEVRALLPNSFVIFLPKDIVSGDFYWFKQAAEAVYVGVVDCTGHGVPGAFMSLIGYASLNEIFAQNPNLSPAEMLDELNLRIQTLLRPKNDTSRQADGMDVCLCRIEYHKRKVTFAGAKRPLYRLSAEGHLEEIKGDKKSIGDRKTMRFTNHELVLGKGESIYLTTDGYADQQNTEGRKFGSNHLKAELEKWGHLDASLQKEKLEDTLLRYRLLKEKELLPEWRNKPLHQLGEQAFIEQRDDISMIGVKF
jgi:ligand-binding sensor domain-containing protein